MININEDLECGDLKEYHFISAHHQLNTGDHALRHTLDCKARANSRLFPAICLIKTSDIIALQNAILRNKLLKANRKRTTACFDSTDQVPLIIYVSVTFIWWPPSRKGSLLKGLLDSVINLTLCSFWLFHLLKSRQHFYGFSIWLKILDFL